MDNEHTTVNYDVPNRCPECGRKLAVDETITLERDPLDKGKATAWHPECYIADRLYR